MKIKLSQPKEESGQKFDWDLSSYAASEVINLQHLRIPTEISKSKHISISSLQSCFSKQL